MLGYLTPEDVPDKLQCRAIFIPNGETWFGLITGALQILTEPENYTKWGALTPEETAEIWLPLWDDFCARKGACKMIGEIVTWAGNTNPYPDMWLDCDGTSLVRDDYPELFDVIGTTYGSVDGTHFNLPDLRGRIAVNAGAGPGLSARALGDSYGEEDHVLSIAEIPSHDHTQTAVILLGTSVPPPFDAYGPFPFPAQTGLTGGGGAHNNIQPSLVFNVYIVAAQVM